MGKIFSAYVKRPVKNWNIENRAHRFIEKEAKHPSPRHPSTAAAFEHLVTGMHSCFNTTLCLKKHELSYRKQIARQLRTQYVEGIYDNSVPLKSRSTVTQGHWKRNH